MTWTKTLDEFIKFKQLFKNYQVHLVISSVSFIYGTLVRFFGTLYAETLIFACSLFFFSITLFIKFFGSRIFPQPRLPTFTLPPQRPRVDVPPKKHHCYTGIDLVHEYFKTARNPPEKLKNLFESPVVPLIPRDVMRAAFDKNPYSVVCPLDGDGEVRGFLELWAIRPKKIHDLCQGKIQESDLKEEDFLDYSPRTNAFYVAAFIECMAEHRKGIPNEATRHTLHNEGENAATLLRYGLKGMAVLIKEAYLSKGQNKIKLYAIKESKGGGDLMKKLGFVLEESLSSNRADGKKAYSLEVDQDYLRDITKKRKLDDCHIKHASSRKPATETAPEPVNL